jgi:hypothetical protein
LRRWRRKPSRPEIRSAEQQQKWAEAQKQEEEQPALQAEKEKIADLQEPHMLREKAAKSDQPKPHKRTIDEVEEEDVGTSGC